MAQVLVTDSLFIAPEHESQIAAAGFDIVRLDKPRATTAELVDAVAGKVGYILGGIETVTQEVIDAGDALRAIAFTGSGYTEFIPAWEYATARGIAISAAVGGNAESVADFALVSGMALVRNLPALTTPGGPGFSITREIAGLTLGIVGYGNIGQALARKALALGMRVVVTPSSRTAPPSTGPEGIEVADIGQIVEVSDVISVHVSKGRGQGALDAAAIGAMRTGGVIVNASFEEAIDNLALLKRVEAGELRAALDYPIGHEAAPLGSVLSSNAQTAFNTAEANARISDRATSSLLNLLSGRPDPDLVNPEYVEHRAGRG